MKGGIYDHVWDGFARYSTDENWHVPHFEKMLYDQAQLLVAYSQAYQVTKEDKYKEVIQGILRYASRDLKHEKGIWPSQQFHFLYLIDHYNLRIMKFKYRIKTFPFVFQVDFTAQRTPILYPNLIPNIKGKAHSVFGQ